MQEPAPDSPRHKNRPQTQTPDIRSYAVMQEPAPDMQEPAPETHQDLFGEVLDFGSIIRIWLLWFYFNNFMIFI